MSDYGDVALKSRRKLTLQSGTYRFGIVQTESDCQLIPEQVFRSDLHP
jgi:hypothetical protein